MSVPLERGRLDRLRNEYAGLSREGIVAEYRNAWGGLIGTPDSVQAYQVMRMANTLLSDRGEDPLDLGGSCRHPF